MEFTCTSYICVLQNLCYTGNSFSLSGYCTEIFFAITITHRFSMKFLKKFFAVSVTVNTFLIFHTLRILNTLRMFNMLWIFNTLQMCVFLLLMTGWRYLMRCLLQKNWMTTRCGRFCLIWTVHIMPLIASYTTTEA